MISPKTEHIIKRVAVFAIFIVAIFWLTNYIAEEESIQYLVNSFGYYGIYTASVISGFNLIVPIPIIAFISIFLDAGFGFWTTIFVIAAGMTTGDLLGYFLGRLGRHLVQEGMGSKVWVSKKLISIREKNPHLPYLFLFIMASFVPLPNEITVLPMSFLGYKLVFILPIVFVGNLIFNYLSATGVIALFNFLG